MTDDTAYVQGFLDRGLPVPDGDYSCPDGAVIPGAYIERAKAAGREQDYPGDGFRLSEGPGAARITFRDGSYVILSGYITPGPRPPGEGVPGDVLLGKNGNCITLPGPAAAPRFEAGGIGYGVQVNGGTGTGTIWLDPGTAGAPR